MGDVFARTAAAFDPSAVSSLTGHPDDHAFARVLVTRFRAMLPERVRRVAAALDGDDHRESMDAVLSLKVSSGTVGARELLLLAGRLEERLRRTDRAGARVVAAKLPSAARRADAALAAFLDS